MCKRQNLHQSDPGIGMHRRQGRMQRSCHSRLPGSELAQPEQSTAISMTCRVHRSCAEYCSGPMVDTRSWALKQRRRLLPCHGRRPGQVRVAAMTIRKLRRRCRYLDAHGAQDGMTRRRMPQQVMGWLADRGLFETDRSAMACAAMAIMALNRRHRLEPPSAGLRAFHSEPHTG